MPGFVLPTGRKTALIGDAGRLSFDDVNALVSGLQARLASEFSRPPQRVLGCLDDSLASLLALLACPEVTDYMPVNPNLLDQDVMDLAERGGADAAILSKSAFEKLGTRLSERGLEVLEWDTIFEDALGADVMVSKGSVGFWPKRRGRLILHTSGTTGLPKRVPITLNAMMQSAHNIAKHHDLKADDLALNTLPTFHIGAVVDVLLAPFYGGGAVALSSDRSPRGIASAIRDIRPTWVQVVPTLLLHLTESLEENELKDLGSSLRFIRSISAPVPNALRTKAEALLRCPIIEMYGMTETAGQITTNGRAEADRKVGTVGRETAVKIKILDPTGSALSANQLGEICVKGATVFDGYEDVPRDDVFHGEWFRTGDQGAFDNDGFLTISGRIKEMINVGGEKLSPSEIEIVALQHPDVVEAAAYSVPHETLGEVSGLTVAVRQPVDPSALQEFMALKLAEFKRPRRIRQVSELPRLPNAKVDRLKVSRDAAIEAKTNSKPSQGTLYAEGSVEKAVAKQWVRVLKSRVPEGSDDFFDMGGDSLSAIEFLLNLSKALQRELPTNQLFVTPTFEGMVAAASKESANSAQKRPRSVDFVSTKMAGWPGQVVLENGLFRGTGTVQNGQALFWSCQTVAEVDLVRRTFGAGRPLYVVRSLFRMSGKSFFRRKKRSDVDFDALSNTLVNEINQIQPAGEVCIGGFCGGGMVMERVAQKLITSGRKIRVFVSLDHWPKAPIQAPVIHVMTQSKRHSARNFLKHIDIPLQALHPQGVSVLKIDAPHLFSPDDFQAESKKIKAAVDGFCVPKVDKELPNSWSYHDRAHPPSVTVLSYQLPRFYRRDAKLEFKIKIRNTSNRVLNHFLQSGLAFEVTFYNLDGCIRHGFSGFAPLLDNVAPGEAATLVGQLNFPKKRVPLIIKGEFKSHGIPSVSLRAKASFTQIVLPHFSNQ